MNYIKETIEYLTKVFQWWIIIQPWERAVRTRFGKHYRVILPGTHLRIPFFDTFYIQTIRLRVVSIPPQTVTSKDGKTLTVVIAVGYSICDIQKLYNKLYQPEVTICNMVQGEIAGFVAGCDLVDCSPSKIEEHLYNKLKEFDHGLNYEYLKLTGYAVVRTFRLIQDSHWIQDNLNMMDKR